MHSARRNLLGHVKLDKATQIYANQRMMRRVTDPRHKDEIPDLPLETRATKRRDAQARVAAKANAQTV